MQKIPIIELKIREMEHQVHHAMMLHQEEIAEHVNRGVEHALANIGEQIAQQAAEEAARQIQIEVHNYFAFGAGAVAIRETITKALEPVVKALRGD